MRVTLDFFHDLDPSGIEWFLLPVDLTTVAGGCECNVGAESDRCGMDRRVENVDQLVEVGWVGCHDCDVSMT